MRFDCERQNVHGGGKYHVMMSGYRWTAFRIPAMSTIIAAASSAATISASSYVMRLHWLHLMLLQMNSKLSQYIGQFVGGTQPKVHSPVQRHFAGRRLAYRFVNSGECMWAASLACNRAH